MRPLCAREENWKKKKEKKKKEKKKEWVGGLSKVGTVQIQRLIECSEEQENQMHHVLNN